MKTQKEIESRVTPEIVKGMVELAEGFDLDTDGTFIEGIILPNGTEVDFENIQNDDIIFPLLIHRAVEGWNKLNEKLYIEVDHSVWFYGEKEIIEYGLNKYKPTTLTACELALLDCLVDVLSGEGI